MLTIIEVTKNFYRYVGKTWSEDDPKMEPGVYYRFHAFKPDDFMKRRLGLMAVRNMNEKDPRRQFMWICEYAPWIKYVLDGKINPPRILSTSVDWAIVGIDPSRLRTWQREFIERCWFFLENTKPFRMIGHISLGGGKTLTGLCLLNLAEPGLVVAPKHVFETWISEAAKFGFPKPVCTTYESCHKFIESKPDVVIFDEVHYLKNSESLRHNHALELSKNASISVGFTASLTGGRGPLDLQSVRVIAPGCFPGNETALRHIFGLDTKLEEVAPGRKAYVTSTWDTKKIAEFVKPWVETVDTSALLSELPPLTERIVTLPTPKDYGIISKGASTTRSASKRVAQCRQCSDGFVEMDDGSIVRLDDAKIKWVRQEVEFLGESVVIYAAWRETITALAEAFKDMHPSILEGGMGDPSFQIERFKTGQTKILIANAKYSSGLNLQECCRIMIFVSLSLSPNDLFQAKGRIYRPGQKKGCQIIFLQSEGTMDQRAYELVTNHLDYSEEQVEALLSES